MLKISEFSKIALVPVTLLRYYEKIGLFQPQHVDTVNNYRYYSVEQLPDLSRIMALKELGLSLEQVAKLVREKVSAEEIRGMYTLRKAQIEQNLQAEAQRLSLIETRLKQLERDQGESRDDVMLKSVPSQPFLSHREVYSDAYAAEKALLELKQQRNRLGVHLGHLTILLHDEAYAMTEMDLEMGYVLSKTTNSTVSLPSGRVLTPSDLPALETAVCAVWVGTVENCFASYRDLGLWLETNRYELQTPHREIMIVPPVPLGTNDAVVEIQIPVKARD